MWGARSAAGRQSPPRAGRCRARPRDMPGGCERPPTGDVRIRALRPVGIHSGMLSPGTASPQRPASAARRPLTAGGSASAEPAAEDEAQGLSEEFLQQHCGVEDLSEVNRIDLCVNSLTHNVEVLGSMLPNLLHLK
ncbi:unnamed protein product, partial [Prorocentrum cordatum]